MPHCIPSAARGSLDPLARCAWVGEGGGGWFQLLWKKPVRYAIPLQPPSRAQVQHTCGPAARAMPHPHRMQPLCPYCLTPSDCPFVCATHISRLSPRPSTSPNTPCPASHAPLLRTGVVLMMSESAARVELAAGEPECDAVEGGSSAAPVRRPALLQAATAQECAQAVLARRTGGTRP